MNSVFCRHSSLEPAVIQEVINVFRRDDKIDMEQVDRALSEMCPSSDQRGATSRQYEQPVDATTPGVPRAQAVDVSPTPVQQHQQIDVPARPTEQNLYNISPEGHSGSSSVAAPQPRAGTAGTTQHTEGGEGIRRQDSGRLEFLLSVFTSLDPGVVAAVYQPGSNLDSAVSTLEEISGQKMMRQEEGTSVDPVQKDPVELRASLIRRFPIVPTHKVDEILAAHGSDEDTCIAHLLAAAYNEGGCSADGQVHKPEDVAGVRERLIQRFPTVPVSEIEELISRHAGNEDTCVAHILARADESGAADVSANYEREQQDAKFLETLEAGVTRADDALRRKILAVRQRLRTELLDKGLLACMPPAERIAAALVYCQLDAEKAQRLLRHNGAVTLPAFEELYKTSTRLAPNDAPSCSDRNGNGASCSHAADSHAGPSAPPPEPSAPPFDPSAASTSHHPPPAPPQFDNFSPQRHPLSPQASDHACDASMHSCDAYGDNAAQTFQLHRPGSQSAMDACDVAGPSRASTSHHMHDVDDRWECATSPDCMEVEGGHDFAALQQLRARLVQPPPDDTLSALLLCTNGDVPVALKMLSESGMQLLPDPNGNGDGTRAGPLLPTHAHGAHAGHGNDTSSHVQDMHQVRGAEGPAQAATQEDEAVLVWLWRPHPLAYWVAGEVAEVDMCDGEPKLTVNTQEGVIGDVEQGLLWPRGRGEAPPAALDDDAEADDKGGAAERRVSDGGGDDIADCRGRDRRLGSRGNYCFVAQAAGDPSPERVLTIPLPPEDADEDLTRYRGEQLARKTQQLYLRLNAPLNDIKREISALQRTIQQGGSGSSRKKLRSLMAHKKVQKQLLEEEVTKRMFKARNRHTDYTKVDYHGLGVDEAIRLLGKKLEYLKRNPDPARQILLIITGRGLHSKDNFSRLYHAIGEYLSLEGNVQHFRIAHVGMLGSYVVEVFQDHEVPRPPSEAEARDTIRRLW